MSDQPIDLIRRLPHLYYAIEDAAMVGERELDGQYGIELQRLASETYDALAEAINACQLPTQARGRAVLALKTLRKSAAKRARINVAGRVLMAVPRDAGALSERRAADMKANLEASAECISVEAIAARTLLELLHTTAA